MTACPFCFEPLPPEDPDDALVVSGARLVDLIAEAARQSPQAAEAYALLREVNPSILPLSERQRQLENHTTGAA